jgi:hypothetical protein
VVGSQHPDRTKSAEIQATNWMPERGVGVVSDLSTEASRGTWVDTSFSVSFYTWNLQRRFGEDWRPKWAEFTRQRLAAWGFNTVHNWGGRNPADPRVPYALMMRGWHTGRTIMGMPDVYAEDFARSVDEAAASQLGPLRVDPFMLGYFIGNEPPWPGRESQLCDAILAGQASEIQKRLRVHLSEGDTPARRS